MSTTVKSLSPNQAARQAGVSRWTIHRAIDAKELHATRDNKRAWHIEQADLDAWMNSSAFMLRTAAQHADQQPANSPTTPPTAPPPYPDLRTDVRGLEVERDQLRERLAATEALMRERVTEAKAERERLLGMMERMAAEAARPWWQRLLGRGG